MKLNNKKSIKKELNNKLFDNINGYSLDTEQRKAILTNKENILLLAPAGSGKTLTIVGKIRYLIEEKKMKEEDVLAISFTNDSVNSLKSALSKEYRYNIDVYTFHKLSLNIINETQENINIAQNNLLSYIIDEFFYRNISNSNLLETNAYENLKKLILTFINLFKSNNYTIDKFNKILKKIKYSKKYVLLWIIKNIYLEYEEELKSTCKIDFNDMINYATDIIRNNGIIKKYKYIIIDEYQDTSINKYDLINELQKRLSCNLFVVGDDFQSIYRFSGCSMNIILNFKKYYKNSKILKINTTYRNSYELIKVSNKFIMKNKNQIRKKVNSKKHINKPIVIVYTNNIKESFKKIIDNINTNILVLGRNNNDVYKILDNNIIFKDSNLTYKEKNMRYLTVHKSKGLEEENVVLINLENSILGFPNKITDNEILNYVSNKKNSYPYEEERRLFYVALTRTKNYIYLLVKLAMLYDKTLILHSYLSVPFRHENELYKFEDYDLELRKLATKYDNVEYIDITDLQDKPEFLNADLIHYNEKMYLELYSKINEMMIRKKKESKIIMPQ